jgi:hypothetical protein
MAIGLGPDDRLRLSMARSGEAEIDMGGSVDGKEERDQAGLERKCTP